jgi:SAM-dependent methyltransferase
MLERIGIHAGEKVIDLGCGPGGALHLLAKRVGARGSVLGLERGPRFVELARRFVADLALAQVEVCEGDAYATGLPRAAFDGAHMRLVLVNVPRPEEIVREMVALVRPGGWVASLEADWLTHICDPPLPAWSRLIDAFVANCAAHGIDPFIGRRVHRLLRDAGVVDIEIDPVCHAYPLGHDRRPILHDFIGNVRDALLAADLVHAEQLNEDMEALDRYLANPDHLVLSHTFFRVWGRIPA